MKQCRKFWRMAPLLVAGLLAFAQENWSMSVKIESLPARIALRLPEVIAAGPGAATVLASRDLVIGVSHDGAARYGLVDQVTGQSPAARQALAQLEAGSDRLQPLSGALGPLLHERVIPGPIVRALLIAIEAHARAKEQTPLSSVMWRVQDEQVTVMLVPARGEVDVAPIGGGTSLGLEEHYVIDLREQRLLRRLLAR